MVKKLEIKYGSNVYTQEILPVRSALMLRSRWTTESGQVDEIKMYELVLENMFTETYSLDDFLNVAEVDYIVQQAVVNQYAGKKPSANSPTDKKKKKK